MQQWVDAINSAILSKPSLEHSILTRDSIRFISHSLAKQEQSKINFTESLNETQAKGTNATLDFVLK
jgi:hypothetical protein